MKNVTRNLIVILLFGVTLAAILPQRLWFGYHGAVPTLAPASGVNASGAGQESYPLLVTEGKSPDLTDAARLLEQRMGKQTGQYSGRRENPRKYAPSGERKGQTSEASTEVSSAVTTGTSINQTTTGNRTTTTGKTNATDQNKTTTSGKNTTAVTSTTAGKTTTTAKPKEDSGNPYIKNADYRSPYYIVVYTGSQSAVVYGKDNDGKYTRLVKSFTVSTGIKGSSPTRTGMYKIRAKYRWRLLVGNVYGQYSSSIGNNYLFHSVPYKKQSASALDNAEYDKLGRDASHGCIRMCVRDCKWIYDNAPIGTQVNVVTASGPAGMGVPARNRDSKYSGWDPSDRWASGNPYFSSSATTTTKKTTVTTATTTATTTTTSTVTTTASATTVTTTTTEPATSKTTSSTAVSTTESKTTVSQTTQQTTVPTEGASDAENGE